MRKNRDRAAGRAGEAGLGGRGDSVGSRTLLLIFIRPSLSPDPLALACPGPTSPSGCLPISLTPILLTFAAPPRISPAHPASISSTP